MNVFSENPLSGLQTTNFKEQTIEKEFECFDESICRKVRIKIQINFTKDYQVIYSKNGIVLRREQVLDNLKKPEIFNNMNQIEYLSWQGEIDKNKKQDGRWIAIWNKKILKNVGGYYEDGLKQGLWKELFLNYCDEAQVFEIGEYQNNLKMGNWKYICKDKFIGGGFYNKDGQRQGKWIELDEGFCREKQVTYAGEYNMKGMKVARWDTFYNYYDNNYGLKNKQIGGGQYHQEGNFKKIGKWVELVEGFYDDKNVINNGIYDMNGMKVDRWDIMYYNRKKKEYQQIGGGSYDQDGGQQKIGRWIELNDGFNDFWLTQNLFTNHGEYNVNGMKIGDWVEISLDDKQHIGVNQDDI